MPTTFYFAVFLATASSTSAAQDASPTASSFASSDMTAARIAEAIADPMAEPCYPLVVKGKGMAGMEFKVGCFTTPYSRVTMAARAARKRYKPFAGADVTAEMLASEIHVYGFPQKRLGTAVRRGAVMTNVETIVVIPPGSKDRAAAIQPTRIGEITPEYRSLLGVGLDGRGMVAAFPISALEPDADVRIVYDEWSCGGRDGRGTADCGVTLILKGVR